MDSKVALADSTRRPEIIPGGLLLSLMEPCVFSTQKVMLAVKVAIEEGSCLGGVSSKADNAMFQLNNSSHEITWSPVSLGCFVHNLYKHSDRRINSGDH